MPKTSSSSSKATLINKLISLSSQQIMYVLLLACSFLIGYLVARVQALEGNTAGVQTTQPTAQTDTNQPVVPQVSLDKVKEVFEKSQIKFGDSSSKLIAIEVADPSCPFCHAAAGKNPELSKQMGPQFVLKSDGGNYIAPVEELKKLVDQNKASFAYIYYPGHGTGEMGTKAMYCANDQGKFWEVHDLLMTNDGYNLLNNTVKNDKAKSQELADFLASAIDSAFLKNCLESGKYDARLQEDMALAQELGISGTPGFYLNDTNYAGAYNFTDMEKTVQGLGL